MGLLSFGGKVRHILLTGISLISLCLAGHCLALEKIKAGDEPDLDFRNGNTDADYGQQGVPDKKAPERRLRLDATNYVSLSASLVVPYSDHNIDYDSQTLYSLSAWARLGQYLRMGVSAGVGHGKVRANHDPIYIGGLQFVNVVDGIESDSESYSGNFRWSLLGDAPSTPFIGFSRSRTDYDSRYVYDQYLVDISSTTPVDSIGGHVALDGSRVYANAWSAGYEHAVNHLVSLSASINRSVAGDNLSRSVMASADCWVNPRLAFSFAVSRNYDYDNTTLTLAFSLVSP